MANSGVPREVSTDDDESDALCGGDEKGSGTEACVEFYTKLSVTWVSVSEYF